MRVCQHCETVVNLMWEKQQIHLFRKVICKDRNFSCGRVFYIF